MFGGCTALSVSDLVRNPKDRLYCDKAHIHSLNYISVRKNWVTESGKELEMSGMYKHTVFTYHYLSLVVRKPVFRVSDQVRHKPGCTATEDGKRLEISDLGSRGIVLS